MAGLGNGLNIGFMEEDSSEIFIFLVFQRDRRHWEKDQVREMNIMDLILGTFSLMWFSRYICGPRNFSGLELTIIVGDPTMLYVYLVLPEKDYQEIVIREGELEWRLEELRYLPPEIKDYICTKGYLREDQKIDQEIRKKKSLMDIKIRQQHKK